MIKPFASVQLAVFLLAGATSAQPADPSIKDVQVVQLHSGMNLVKGFLPNGHDAIILQVWRDNGNAHGHRRFLVMFQGTSNGWNLAAVQTGPKSQLEDSVTEDPHTGEDNVSSVRFARGEVDGAKASLLIVAERELGGARSYYDPAPTTISYYRLFDASADGPGTTPFVFRVIKAVHPKQQYCNSDLALSKEAGLPLPITYDGPNTADGCFPEKR